VLNYTAMESSPLERRVLSKITWRLIPFMCLCYLVAFIDRSNAAVAKLQMKSMPWFDDAVYGFGFGIFFLGYFIFEVPSNVLLEKFGPRIWIARIMILWGVISSAMMFAKSEWLFYLLRFLLGAGEAGFFPGMILYLTYWYPTAHRARTVALFMTAAALSAVVGNPMSGALLKMEGVGGLAGWQWLFMLEGVPAAVLGFVVLAYLPNGPQDARWLLAEERAWLTASLGAERAARVRRHSMTLWQALSNGKVLLLSLLYFAVVIGGYGLDSFLPEIVKLRTGWEDNFHVSLLSALPPACAAVVMVILGRRSDRTDTPRAHVLIASFLAAAGIALTALTRHPVPVLIGLCLAVSGRWSAIPPFWALPTAFLSGTAAAGGIAMINSIGNLGGWAGPSIMGWLKKHTDAYTTGLLFLAACFVAGGIMAVSLKFRAAPDPEAVEKLLRGSEERA